MGEVLLFKVFFNQPCDSKNPMSFTLMNLLFFHAYEVALDAANGCKCQVAFTEKVKQCQAVLRRDFPSACIFRNQMDVLDVTGLTNVWTATTFEEVCQRSAAASFAPEAFCAQHHGQCPLPCDVDLCYLSSPCTDDSVQGSQSQDNGATRKESRLHHARELGFALVFGNALAQSPMTFAVDRVNMDLLVWLTPVSCVL